jgi:hypothetical protein
MPHFVVFSGHLIDKPHRDPPRFPEPKSTAAGIAIRQALEKIQAATGAAELHGIAAAACGGDILFHEACRELRIPSELYLGIPVDAFQQTSVAFAGKDWIARYQKLVRDLPVHILYPQETADAANEVWEKANQWMLDTALPAGGANVTLLVLWDGNKGETGGTAHMIDVARAEHAAVDIVDTHKI